ncbi:glycosyltransferase [Veillonella criceti]|uniref:Uncharacterized protein n=1 Tax=Veillonella criceti TaxID=103891 RepID=A0A380NN68_9FIRM|nr:glycosyltransferase [Veillonella criceti]SUP44756.1 Uncharacterised protein [Veillonella criceti]
MKVLFIRANKGLPDSRVEKELYSLSKEHEVELLGWNREENTENIEEKNIAINNKNFKYYWIGIKAPQGEGFKKILFPMLKFWITICIFLYKNSGKYDVVHFCDFDTSAIAFFVAKFKKMKIVYDIFDYYADSHNAPKFIKSIIKKWENYIINNSDTVILCSEKRREQILPAKAKKIIIINNSPSKAIEFENINLQGDGTRKRLVYVGMLSEDRLLDKIAQVIITRNDIEWHVAGMGILAPYFEKISKKYDNIFYYGKISYPQALCLESQCDYMTAIYDPQVSNHKYADPNKFYEAILLRKPIVVLKGTGIDEVVINKKLGIVLDYNVKNFKRDFSNALNNLVEKNEIYFNRTNASILSDTVYSWEIMEKRLLEAYKWL